MAISGTTSGPELLVELDRAATEPLHRQLANGLRDAIRTGRLAPATRLPSTRVLAADLGVSRRLVVDAYSQLAAEGFLLSRHGSGTRVAKVDAASAPRDVGEPPQQFDIDFAPGSPEMAVSISPTKVTPGIRSAGGQCVRTNCGPSQPPPSASP